MIEYRAARSNTTVGQEDCLKTFFKVWCEQLGIMLRIEVNLTSQSDSEWEEEIREMRRVWGVGRKRKWGGGTSELGLKKETTGRQVWDFRVGRLNCISRVLWIELLSCDDESCFVLFQLIHPLTIFVGIYQYHPPMYVVCMYIILDRKGLHKHSLME